MKILRGKRVGNFREATLLAFQEAREDDISPDIATLFASVIDADKLSAEAERNINITVHGRYGRGARWHGRQ